MRPLRHPRSPNHFAAVAWHPVHPILVTGGSEGAILHWDLSSSTDTLAQSPSQPPGARATLSQAHDSNVWSLAFHPLGHLMVSASNDHTTRFWCRERPGDATSVFSGGGQKPPEVTDTTGQDDEDESMVPGFGFTGAGGQWWGKEEDGDTSMQQHPGLQDAYPRRGVQVQDGGDDYIPGFGASDGPGPVTGRQNGPLPAQEELYPGPGDGDDSFRRGGRNRWGPRRGRH